MKKVIFLVLILSAVLGVLFWKYGLSWFHRPQPANQPITLNIWGLWDDEGTIRPILDAYHESHPNITLIYTKQSLLNYRTRVQTQIRASQGPDIFILHSSWTPLFYQDLAPAPETIMTIGEYKQIFYPMIYETLTSQGKIYAISRDVDGLGMYVNEDILKATGISIPRTWVEFVEAAKKTTVRDQNGQIQTAGVALGTVSNVDFWPEILGLLFFQQPRGDLIQPANKDGIEVLQFYTSFVMDPKNKTWDSTLPASTQMFASGKLAFYFAPAFQAGILKTLNPNLKLKIAPVPQLPGKTVNYGAFWAFGVSSTSKNQNQAWEFLRFSISSQALQLLNQKREESGILGRSYARVEMASLQADDPILGAFITQAPYYKSWYLNSGTEDRGINEEMMGNYAEAVDGVLQGRDPMEILQASQVNIKQTLEKYKIEK